MYQLCIGGTVHKRIRKTLGSTTYYGLPLWAILVSICISSFSFLAAIQSNHNQVSILNVLALLNAADDSVI
jgi:amino acid permease